MQRALKSARQEQESAIEQLAKHLREALRATRDELSAAGFAAPRTLEDWEHLARLVEIPFETVRSGDYTLADVHAAALAWVEREQMRQHIARQTRAESHRPPSNTLAHEDTLIDADSHLSPAKLAAMLDVPADALRTRLNRWRSQNHTGWIENPDRGPREAKYLYRVGSVRSIIAALQATSGTTSKRPPKKN
jgi:hypothetical protein